MINNGNSMILTDDRIAELLRINPDLLKRKQACGPGDDLQRHTITEAVYLGDPIGKPRMTQKDKWALRPEVGRYRSFADELRFTFGRVTKFEKAPIQLNWRAYFEMPASWSNKRKLELAGAPHRQKPDRDNIDKAILDALFQDDSGVAFGEMSKFWDDGLGARIEITIIWS